MATLQTLLSGQRVLIADSSLCQSLFNYRQLLGNPFTISQIIDDPTLLSLRQTYLSTQMTIAMTNTFDANRYKLRHLGLEQFVHTINERSAFLLREAIGQEDENIVIGGNIGPFSRHISFAEAVSAFAEQAEALAAGGVDFLWLESFSSCEQAEAAILGCELGATDLPLVITFSFAKGKRLPVDILPATAVKACLKHRSVIALGADTGSGQTDLFDCLGQLQQIIQQIPLVAKINLKVIESQAQQSIADPDFTQRAFAQFAKQACQGGVKIVSTSHDCTADHLAVISDTIVALDRGGNQPYNKARISPKI